MALFSKKTELELVLEGRQVVAGQTVRAQVSTGEPDGKIHCSRLELLYRNTYRVEVPDGVSKGTKDVIVESHPLPGRHRDSQRRAHRALECARQLGRLGRVDGARG